MVSASVFGAKALHSSIKTEISDFSQSEFGLLNRRHN